MIIKKTAKGIKLVEILWVLDTRVTANKVIDDFVSSNREFLKQGMINKFNKLIEGKLEIISVRIKGKKKNTLKNTDGMNHEIFHGPLLNWFQVGIIILRTGGDLHELFKSLLGKSSLGNKFSLSFHTDGQSEIQVEVGVHIKQLRQGMCGEERLTG